MDHQTKVVADLDSMVYAEHQVALNAKTMLQDNKFFAKTLCHTLPLGFQRVYIDSGYTVDLRIEIHINVV